MNITDGDISVTFAEALLEGVYKKMQDMNTQATLVVGHGSRSAEAVQNFEAIVKMVTDKLGTKIYGAHMELAEPSIEQTVAALWSEGVRDFLIIPYFLYQGNHIKHDIPEILAQLQASLPGMTYTMGQHIGEEPLMADIIIKRIVQAQ